MTVGGKYNWVNQPERLVYVGKEGSWNQFKRIGDPSAVWCEVPDSELHRIEETLEPVQPVQPATERGTKEAKQIAAMANKFAGRCGKATADFELPAPNDDVSTNRAQPVQPAVIASGLHRFMDAAAGEGFVLGGVDAAELYIELFPDFYAEAAHDIKEAK